MSEKKIKHDDELARFYDSHRDVLELLDRVLQPANDISLANFETPALNTDPTEKVATADRDPKPFDSAEDKLAERSDLPKAIGRFQIRKLLGQGGFGIVFLAYDPQLKRLVALKIPRPEAVLTDESKTRFVREAETAASLNHAGIVPIFEAGSYGLICYIAAGYCDGPSLAEWADQQASPIAVSQAVEMAIQLADAVQHAHSRRIIHRDLKPQNILLENEIDNFSANDANGPESYRLVITDFGLAKSLNETEELTKSNSVLGTPSYMAPEQIGNTAHSVGAASDIYSLGAVLYFLLCGQPPFAGKSLLETLKLVDDQPPVAPRKMRNEVPADLSAICMKCLEKDPQRRYASASEFQSDLIRFQNGLPISARPVSVTERLIRWTKRKPALASSLAALALSIVVALVAISILLVRSEFHRGRAENKSVELSGALDRLQNRTQDLKSAFDDLFTSIAMTPEIRIPGAESLRKRLLVSVNGYYRDLANESPSDSTIADYVSTLNRIADVKQLLDDHAGALVVAKQAVKLLNSSDRSKPDVRRAEIHSHLVFAKTFAAMGKQNEFFEKSSEVIELAKSYFNSPQVNESDAIDLARTYTELSSTAIRYGHRTFGNQLNREAMLLWELVGHNDLDDEAAYEFVHAHVVAGVGLASSEKSGEAAAYLDLALEVAELRLQGPLAQHPAFVSEVARAYRVRGFTLIDDQSRAEVHFQKALELLTGLLAEHPLVPDYSVQVAQLRYQWALAHFISGRHEQAIERLGENQEFVHEAMDTFPSVKSKLLRNKADTLALTGYAWQHLNQLESALESLRESRRVNEEVVEITNQALQAQLQLQGVIGGMATVEGKLGNPDAAIKLLNESNAELRAILEMDPENGECARYLAGNLGYLRTFYGQLGQWQEALTVFDESMQFDKVLPPEFRKGQRAALYLRLHDLAKASNDFAEFQLYPAQENPERARQFAEIAIRFLQTIDEVRSEFESTDRLAELSELRSKAVSCAIQRLDEMRENPDVEQTHWNQLFGDSADDSSIPEIFHWREQHSL